MQVREVMTINPHVIQVDAPVRLAAQELRRHDVGGLPVFDAERLVGFITDRDLACGCLSAAHDPATCVVRQHMMVDPISVDADASIEDALSLMATRQVRRLLVKTNDGSAGIVSIGDIAVHSPGDPQVSRALAAICQPIRETATR
jgi:CBS domain-containing protein